MTTAIPSALVVSNVSHKTCMSRILFRGNIFDLSHSQASSKESMSHAMLKNFFVSAFLGMNA